MFDSQSSGSELLLYEFVFDRVGQCDSAARLVGLLDFLRRSFERWLQFY